MLQADLALLKPAKKYFNTFSPFSIIPLHHQWNRNRLLSSENECKSCLTRCQMTWDLGPKDVLRKSQNWSGFLKNKGDNLLKRLLIKKLSTANRIFTHLSDIGFVSVKTIKWFCTNCWIFLIESNFKKIFRANSKLWGLLHYWKLKQKS